MIRKPAAIAALLSCALSAAWAGAFGARDWAKYPPIVDRTRPEALWAIGDIHGDYERMLRLLLAAHLVETKPGKPERLTWSGGAATLVVTGDMIDKGPKPMDVLRSLLALQASARRQGGEVIVLAGNHEAELLEPEGRPSKDRAADWARLGVTPASLQACEGQVGQFLCSLPFGARLGDWFFSHAGNTAGRTIAQLSSGIRAGAYSLTGPDSLLEARLGEGKQWIAPPDSKFGGERQLLESYAAALGVKHMVQGHQHQAVKFDDGAERGKGEMFQRWGLLFLIDVGMSREIGDSQGAALRITASGASAVCPDGGETPLWDAASNDALGRAICTR